MTCRGRHSCRAGEIPDLGSWKCGHPLASPFPSVFVCAVRFSFLSFPFSISFSYFCSPNSLEDSFITIISNMANVNISNSHILWPKVYVWSCSGFVPNMVTNPSDCSTCAVLFPQRGILGEAANSETH